MHVGVNKALQGARQSYAIGQSLSEGPGKSTFEVLGSRDGRTYIAKLWRHDRDFGPPQGDNSILAANEARMLRQAKGPCFPRLFEFHQKPGYSFLIMEHMGQPIDLQKRIPALEALTLAAEALSEWHDLGLVHMDIKPSNMTLKDQEGRAALIDFEFSRLAGDEHAERKIDIIRFASTITEVMTRVSPSCLPGTPQRQIGLHQWAGDRRCEKLVAACLKFPDQVETRTLAENLRKILVATPTVNSELCFPPRSALLSLSYRLLKSADCYLQEQDGFRIYRAGESIAFGNAGILLAQLWTALLWGRETHIQKSTLDWLAHRPVQVHASGFYTGDAGVACVLALAGHVFDSPFYRQAARKRFQQALHLAEVERNFEAKVGALHASLLLQTCGMEDALDASAFLVKDLLESIRIEEDWIGWSELDPNATASHGTLGAIFTLGCWANAVGERVLQDLCQLWLKLVFHRQRSTASVDEGHSRLLWTGLAAELLDGSSQEFELALEQFMAWPPFAAPNYAEGLAGQLELCRLLQHRSAPDPKLLDERRRKLLQALRLHLIRDPHRCVLPSDRGGMITPDLWMGFTGPALELSLQAVSFHQSIWSPAGWSAILGQCNHTKE